MPRTNRYFLPGHVWHITHRCHERRRLASASLANSPITRASSPSSAISLAASAQAALALLAGFRNAGPALNGTLRTGLHVKASQGEQRFRDDNRLASCQSAGLPRGRFS